MSLHNDIEAMAKSLDLEIYDISTLKENDDTIFRVSVVSSSVVDGKREGVSMDKCVELTHLLSPLLDVNPPMESEYRLEVGSAGIERKIATIKQFELSIGEDAEVVLKDKSRFSGVVSEVADNIIKLELEDGIKEIDFSTISRAKTFFKW